MRIIRKRWNGVPPPAGQRGISLIEVALFIIALGMVTVVGVKIYDRHLQTEKIRVTAERTAMVQKQLETYRKLNNRLPAPAPMDVARDTATFGQEVVITAANVLNSNMTGAFAGTKAIAGRGGRIVRTGTVPTRTLNLPDEAMLDGWGHRIVYAVTQDYVIAGVPVPPDADKGAITVKDSGTGNISGGPTPNSMTSLPGNVIFALISAGPDDRGAYSADGKLVNACPTTTNANAAENCFDNAAANAEFRTSMSLKGNAAGAMAHQVVYASSASPYEWYYKLFKECTTDLCFLNYKIEQWVCRKHRMTEVANSFCETNVSLLPPLNPNGIQATPPDYKITSTGEPHCANVITFHWVEDPSVPWIPASCPAPPLVEACSPSSQNRQMPCLRCDNVPSPGSCSGSPATITSQPCAAQAGVCGAPPAPGCGTTTYANSCGANTCNYPAPCAPEPPTCSPYDTTETGLCPLPPYTGGIRTKVHHFTCPDPMGSPVETSTDAWEESQCTGCSAPVNGAWTAWTAWTACSATCEQTRTHTCENASCGGICPGGAFSGAMESQTQGCTGGACPSGLSYYWDNDGWSACAASCTQGLDWYCRELPANTPVADSFCLSNVGAEPALNSRSCTGGACVGGCTPGICGAAPPGCDGTYADTCGNDGACNLPACGGGGGPPPSCTHTCGPPPGCGPAGDTYPDDCGDHACPKPTCTGDEGTFTWVSYFYSCNTGCTADITQLCNGTCKKQASPPGTKPYSSIAAHCEDESGSTVAPALCGKSQAAMDGENAAGESGAASNCWNDMICPVGSVVGTAVNGCWMGCPDGTLQYPGNSPGCFTIPESSPCSQ